MPIASPMVAKRQTRYTTHAALPTASHALSRAPSGRAVRHVRGHGLWSKASWAIRSNLTSSFRQAVGIYPSCAYGGQRSRPACHAASIGDCGLRRPQSSSTLSKAYTTVMLILRPIAPICLRPHSPPQGLHSPSLRLSRVDGPTPWSYRGPRPQPCLHSPRSSLRTSRLEIGSSTKPPGCCSLPAQRSFHDDFLDAGRPVLLEHDLQLQGLGLDRLELDLVEGVFPGAIGPTVLDRHECAISVFVEDPP